MEAEQKINGNDMTMDAQVALRAPIAPSADAPLTYSATQLQLLKDMIAKGASDLEFEVFIEVSKAKRLDPLKKQIHLVKRWDGELKRYIFTPQTGIDGYRLIADRTGAYAPGSETRFDHDKDGKLISATAFIKKWVRGEWHEISATAFYDEYVQLKKEGGPTSMWRKMPRLMLAKCAEALALRRAFPDELSGLYTHEEMGEAQIQGEAAPITIEAKAVEALPEAGRITREQRKKMNDFIAGLKMRFGLTNEILKAKMLDATGCEHSSELTEEQASDMIGIYATWLNQLEEAAAANESDKQKEVSF